jgi:non-homologous end joining protein Ku
MTEAGEVGIGRVTLSRRERPVMVEPRGADMVLITLRASEEVRTCQEISESTFERIKYGFTTVFSYHML